MSDKRKCFGNREEVGTAKCAHCKDKSACLRKTATPYLPHLRVYKK